MLSLFPAVLLLVSRTAQFLPASRWPRTSRVLIHPPVSNSPLKKPIRATSGPCGRITALPACGRQALPPRIQGFASVARLVFGHNDSASPAERLFQRTAKRHVLKRYKVVSTSVTPAWDFVRIRMSRRAELSRAAAGFSLPGSASCHPPLSPQGVCCSNGRAVA